jgi:hypothetical protein
MRRFPSEKALVTAYWRKLARSNGAARKSRNGVFARGTARGLQTARRLPRKLSGLRPLAQSNSNS